MNVSINLGAWNSIFAVPSALVDQHIKLAGGVQLKVLLWVLRHAGEPFQIEELSASLGIAAADARDAMNYWLETGLLSFHDGTLTPSSETVETAPAASIPAAEQLEEIVEPAEDLELHLPAVEPNTLPVMQSKKTPEPVPVVVATSAPVRHPKPTGVFIAERINQSSEIAFLMQEAQQILGRAISPALSSILLTAYDDYGLPADVIIMLLAYVKSIGKDNSNYIETVAKNWSSEEIFSHEKAQEKLRQLSEIAQAWRSIENTIGINHRSPSSREEQYANRWIYEWKFSTQMIREAYDRCVDATGKMNLSYMNRILERWQKEGISTPQQTSWEQSEKTTARKTEKEQQRTYDLDAYEKMDFLSDPEFLTDKTSK